MFRYLFKRDTILATIMVFVLMGLLALIPFNTHVLDPIKMALQDFDYNDLVYSQMGKNSHTSVDTNIVVVNIGNAGRGDITAMLEKVAAEKPVAIGVDVTFENPKDPATDSALQQFFVTNKNAVLAYNLQTAEEKLQAQGFLYNVVSEKGYANFVGEDGGVIRYFAPAVQKEGSRYTSFAAAVVKLARPASYEKLVKRNKPTETINYSRTANKYIVIDGSELLGDSSGNTVLKNKIVLLGYVSDNPGNIEDKHFTPFNSKSVGKSVPDMNGVFVHANIIDMILADQYVAKSPTWLNWLIAVLLGWLHMALFIRYFLDKHLWFHLLAKTIQVVSAILFVYLGLLFFYKWDIRINLTPAFVAIILAVDVLYFYEAIVAWLHKKLGIQSIFVHHHGH
ncbi:MAG: CHASE2 domain-containing protein [Ferruginibacter sp.]